MNFFGLIDSYTITLTPSDPTRDLALPYNNAFVIYDMKDRDCCLYKEKKDIPPLTETQGVLQLIVTKNNTIKISSPLNQNTLTKMVDFVFRHIKEVRGSDWSGEFVKDAVVISKFNKN